MTDNDELPKWVLVSREQLDDMLPKIDAIKKEGQAETRRGLEKERAANDLQNEAEYLARLLSQDHDPQHWNDEIVTMSGVMLANRIELFKEDVDSILGYVKRGGETGAEYHSGFVNQVSDSDSSAGTAVYLGASIERRFLVLEPTYTAVLTDFEPKRLTAREALFQELKTVLEPFGNKYVVMLDGSETALGVDTPDSQSQAAHSMRDCFQQLLEQLAPSKVVASQPWFEQSEGAPGGISRRSRLRYMLYGPGENVDVKTIQRLDELADIAKDSLDSCMARTHTHDESLTKEEVLLAVDQARHALLHVLKLYNNFRGR